MVSESTNQPEPTESQSWQHRITNEAKPKAMQIFLDEDNMKAMKALAVVADTDVKNYVTTLLLNHIKDHHAEVQEGLPHVENAQGAVANARTTYHKEKITNLRKQLQSVSASRS